VSQRLPSLGLMRAQLRALLTVVLWRTVGFMRPSIGSHDAQVYRTAICLIAGVFPHCESQIRNNVEPDSWSKYFVFHWSTGLWIKIWTQPKWATKPKRNSFASVASPETAVNHIWDVPNVSEDFGQKLFLNISHSTPGHRELTRWYAETPGDMSFR